MACVDDRYPPRPRTAPPNPSPKPAEAGGARAAAVCGSALATLAKAASIPPTPAAAPRLVSGPRHPELAVLEPSLDAGESRRVRNGARVEGSKIRGDDCSTCCAVVFTTTRLTEYTHINHDVKKKCKLSKLSNNFPPKERETESRERDRARERDRERDRDREHRRTYRVRCSTGGCAACVTAAAT